MIQGTQNPFSLSNKKTLSLKLWKVQKKAYPFLQNFDLVIVGYVELAIIGKCTSQLWTSLWELDNVLLMKRKTFVLYFDIVIVAVEIAKIGKWKIKNVLVPELLYKRPLEKVRLALFTCAAKSFKMRSTLIEKSLLTLMQRSCNLDENTGYSIYW